MQRFVRQLISVSLLLCLAGTALEVSAVYTFPAPDHQPGDSESVLAVSPATLGDGVLGEGRGRVARPALRFRCDEGRGVLADRALRLRIRLSTMECPDDRPPSQTLRSIRLQHLRMGNSDADYPSLTGA